MTFEQFKKDILDNIKILPFYWREGQKVFNYIDSNYHVARIVQAKGIDCFYNNNLIDSFIKESFKLIK